ncbi:MAG: hypothetical protein ABGX16_25275 [Pirellulales bacterium]
MPTRSSIHDHECTPLSQNICASEQIEERIPADVLNMPQMGASFSAAEIAVLVTYLSSFNPVAEIKELR